MEVLCQTKNNFEVLFDPEKSHAATHFADTPSLKQLVIEALKQTNISNDRLSFEYVFDRIIGTTDLVTTTDADDIVYAKRSHRDNYTRFTRSQGPQNCSTIFIALNQLDVDRYVLWSAWIGYAGPSFPGGDNETADSRSYWANHALVWGRQEIQPGTETTVVPW